MLTIIGYDFEKFTVGIDLSTMPESTQFVARQAELREMSQLLQGHDARSIVVLCGLGGIGKTQLAREFMKRYKEKYTAMFWLNAKNEESVRLSFRSIAQQIQKYHPASPSHLSFDSSSDLDQTVTAVKNWLEFHKNTRWLLVYDNYDDVSMPGTPVDSAFDLKRFLPGCDHGSILVTTRLSQFPFGARIQVRRLQDVQENLQILSDSSGREAIKDGILLMTHKSFPRTD